MLVRLCLHTIINILLYDFFRWLIQSDEDPFDQLKWLVQVLTEAEENKESVHILGHIPTGSIDVIKVWAREFNKIVNRFANTITGQFAGHVHVDTFQLHYNLSNPDQAINVEWNGASIVPFDNANPSFKLYTIDKETFVSLNLIFRSLNDNSLFTEHYRY